MTAPTTALRPCPVCGGRAADRLHTQQFTLPDHHPLRGGYDVVCCRGCGMAYADTAATQADYDRFYAEMSKYEDAAGGVGGGTAGWDADRLRETARAVAAAVPPSARVLDIGCANGGFLRALSEMGFTRLYGADPSAGCVANTRALVPGAEAAVGWLGRPAFPGERFDVVTLAHVLEHVCDVAGAMQALRGAVADDGLLYLEVPDAGRYTDHVAAPYQDFNTEHINHFSPRSLANLARAHGFEPAGGGTRVIFCPPPVACPIVWGCFRRVESIPAGRLAPDTELRGRIEAYIRESAAMMGRIDARLRAALAGTPEVIVWGTGQLAFKLLTETALASADIVAFVDGNPVNHGKVLAGVPIRSPAEIAGATQPIVVATTLHHRAIADEIRSRYGYPNDIVLLAD